MAAIEDLIKQIADPALRETAVENQVAHALGVPCGIGHGDRGAHSQA